MNAKTTMIKEFLKIMKALYSLPIIIPFILLFLIIRIPLIQIIPDYLDLQHVETPEGYLRSLLAIVTGFSSIILTIFLVVYNSTLKKLKRFSIDYIFTNPWIKLIFSVFCGSLTFIVSSMITVNYNDDNTVIASLYVSSFISFASILTLFPFVIAALQYANSFNRIRDLVSKIDENDKLDLIRSKKIDTDNALENIEKNRVILLKEIGVFAIKENDWAIPQSILNGLYNKLIRTLDEHSSDQDVLDSCTVFTFVANHFKNVAFEESDFITVRQLLGVITKIHIYFTNAKIRNIRWNTIDTCFTDVCRLIVQNRNFYNMQNDILPTAMKIIRAHFRSVSYTDDELQTFGYDLKNMQKDRQHQYNNITGYWFYVKHELPNLFFEPLSEGIKTKNENVYSHFGWEIQHLFDVAYDGESLTENQRESAFNEISSKARNIIELALQHNIFEHLEIYSDIQITKWIINKRESAFTALHDFAFFLVKINRFNQTNYYLNDFFMIARSLATTDMEQENKDRAIRIIVVQAFNLLDVSETPDFVKAEIIKQLKWLNSYFNRQNNLLDLKKEYTEMINQL